MPPASRPLADPARDAARLLGWIGFTVLMIGAPLVGVLSRRALFILLPIGAGLLFAGFFVAVSNQGLKTFRDALTQPLGMAGVLLFVWGGLSLTWTPYPREAIPHFIAMMATALLAALLIAQLPDRRARPTLFLLPAGLAVTAIATLGMALVGPASFRGGTEFDPSLLERSVLTLVVLVWPALGALAAFERWRLASALAVLLAVVVSVASAKIAMAVFAVSAITFAVAVDEPKRAGRAAAVVFGTLIVFAPLVPFLLAPLASAISLVGHSTVLAMNDWRDLVVADGVRLITGHGIDTARHGAVAGFLPAHTPRSVLFEIWYELGILGALAFAAVFVLGFMAAGDAARYVAPALLGGMVAVLAIAVFGVATEDLWFVTLASLQAVAFGLLGRSSRASARPPAMAADAPATAGDAVLSGASRMLP